MKQDFLTSLRSCFKTLSHRLRALFAIFRFSTPHQASEISSKMAAESGRLMLLKQLLSVEIEKKRCGCKEGRCNDAPPAYWRVRHFDVVFPIPGRRLQRFEPIVGNEKAEAVDHRDHHPQPAQPNVKASLDRRPKLQPKAPPLPQFDLKEKFAWRHAPKG